jgi:hypothetical protein
VLLGDGGVLGDRRYDCRISGLRLGLVGSLLRFGLLVHLVLTSGLKDLVRLDDLG